MMDTFIHKRYPKYEQQASFAINWTLSTAYMNGSRDRMVSIIRLLSVAEESIKQPGLGALVAATSAYWAAYNMYPDTLADKKGLLPNNIAERFETELKALDDEDVDTLADVRRWLRKAAALYAVQIKLQRMTDHDEKLNDEDPGGWLDSIGAIDAVWERISPKIQAPGEKGNRWLRSTTNTDTASVINVVSSTTSPGIFELKNAYERWSQVVFEVTGVVENKERFLRSPITLPTKTRVSIALSTWSVPYDRVLKAFGSMLDSDSFRRINTAADRDEAAYKEVLRLGWFITKYGRNWKTS